MKNYKDINDVNELIDFILDVKNIEEDSDQVVYAAEKLTKIVKPENLERLYLELDKADNSFHRECFADPLSKLDGPKCLEQLLIASLRSAEEGSDNDFLYTIIDGVLDKFKKEDVVIIKNIISTTTDKKLKEIANDALAHVADKLHLSQMELK